MYKVIDLFAGPGGLAEGFASVRGADGTRTFEIALSVEKDPSAFATLQLRSFFRKFDRPPDDYYEYLAGGISKSELYDRHPLQWKAVEEETLCLELGAEGSETRIDPLLDHLRSEDPDKVILVGGPPCQAYSLVGRARNRGNAAYIPRDDHRHFLYREYIRILERLRPAAFVMENVKGFLSASVDGDHIFTKVLSDLRHAGGIQESYVVTPLIGHGGRGGRRFVVESERHGIPQTRHRVLLVGVRADLAGESGLFEEAMSDLPLLSGRTVRDAIGGLPRLRSGISRGTDGGEAWRGTVRSAFQEAARFCRKGGSGDHLAVADQLERHADRVGSGRVPPRTSGRTARRSSGELAEWLVDPRLTVLPDHASRGHMTSDLARYAFAATFAEVVGRSPTARDFPAGLAPAHRSWSSGKFNDRFRVQLWKQPASTITSHIAKDGHYFIHPDPLQCRSLTVREAARLQTFPDNYKFEGNRTQQFTQVGNAVPPLLAREIAKVVGERLDRYRRRRSSSVPDSPKLAAPA